MLTKTHLAIGFFASLLLLDRITYGITFIIVVLFSSILPDLDTAFSVIGKKTIFRPIQFFTKHRGFFHSFTFCLAVSLFFAWYFPILALPFFLGYGLHLFADAFTVDGIRPFWPFKKSSSGMLRVGSAFEDVLFIGFCIADGVLVVLHAV
jgi:inner membrane protein